MKQIIALITVLTALLLPLREGSRGRVIARRYVRLRYQRTTAEGMPMGREYRSFIWRGAILECGHYWGVPDPFGSLTGDERMSAYDLATRAVARLPVPYVALDVGQRETGEWIVIEANDAQFSGLGAIPVLSLWSKLATCR